MDALHATYEHTRIQSIPGSIGLHRMNPNQYLHHRKDHQAPQKHRRKDPTEVEEKSTTKLKRTRLVKCSKCGQLGHYAKTCKGPAAPRNKQKSAPMSISIETNMHGEIPLSQGGPAPEDLGHQGELHENELLCIGCNEVGCI
ncbi:hypothetical protein K1719_039137 [Acacia pycnantha]|nr:hypothetical protein K1719_039137 [Acacia pycnantha]